MVVRHPPAVWLMQVREQIEQLAQLEANWDSYGAIPVDPEAIRTALDIAESLGMHPAVMPPVVTATPDGHVGLCWDTGDRSVDASIEAGGVIDMVVLERTNPDRDREVRTSDVADLLSALTDS